MGSHCEEIMKELNAKNDEVAFLNAQRSDKDVVVQNAEAHIRTVEAALHFESQQRDVAVSMAREVATGQSAVLLLYEQQIERQRVEQAAQASHPNTMYFDAERHIFSLEGLAQNANAKTEEYAQLLSGSVSTVYALEGETSRLQQTIVMHCEEIAHTTRYYEEMKGSCNCMTTTNHTLRAQLNRLNPHLLPNSGVRPRVSRKIFA